MPLSQMEFVKLQHLLADIHNEESLLNDSDLPLSEFNPLIYKSTLGDSCLHIAAWRSNFDAVKLLIKGGIDVNLSLIHI